MRGNSDADPHGFYRGRNRVGGLTDAHLRRQQAPVSSPCSRSSSFSRTFRNFGRDPWSDWRDPRSEWAEVRARIYTSHTEGDSPRSSLESVAGGYSKAARRRAATRDTMTPGLSMADSLASFMTSAKEKANSARESVTAVNPLPRERFESQEITQEFLLRAADEQGRPKVESLEDLGFTTEELSRVFYQQLKENDLPIFLDRIHFHQNGGLNRIPEIWTDHKYFWFFVLIFSVIFNIASLLVMNQSLVANYLGEAYKGEAIDITHEDQELEQAILVADFKYIPDHRTRAVFVRVAAMVACWEVSWIVVKAIHLIRLWWLFRTDKSEYRAFHAVVFVFQKLLPQFATFSAIKLVAKVHPALFFNEFLHYRSETSWRGTWYGSTFIFSVFLVKTFSCAIAAVAAFVVKLLAVGLRLINPQYYLIYRGACAIALMNQCVGVILLEVVLQDRMFLFVFGGQDAAYRDDERALKNVYEARLARAIWLDYWAKGERLKAIVLLATFDHYDLQQLIIEDVNVEEEHGFETLLEEDEHDQALPEDEAPSSWPWSPMSNSASPRSLGVVASAARPYRTSVPQGQDPSTPSSFMLASPPITPHKDSPKRSEAGSLSPTSSQTQLLPPEKPEVDASTASSAAMRVLSKMLEADDDTTSE